ncbi:family 65 glycosyl hydrolase [Arthrobacter pityocampae]|uniref:Family 65 glycosyl hydrolase n=1 Tax=Arthrobacter pityocampae TaxID=547334 RepID=A0A2S5IW20_9MICC|nr:beta-phosphoglucomutase family hydrolase [Arthrobacter pityocampae]PPB48763.1 family 65 glycosyl hydrolase [Arthrobacter pityocampae]
MGPEARSTDAPAERSRPARRGAGSPTVAGTASPFDAVILDLDGVVTDTASVHRAAWKQLFDAVLADPRIPAGADVRPFDDADYYAWVDGRPREQGVAVFLRSRGIRLTPGTPSDPPDAWTEQGLGAAKNALFVDELRRHGVRAFPGTMELLRRLHESRVPCALVTASRNAGAVLAAAGLDGAFDVVVDGTVAAELGLPGKPDPATFLEAARRLTARPARTVVLEDATSGVAAAHAGGFGLIVGIDRAEQRTALERAGAHLVLDDARQLDMGLVLTHRWHLIYDGFDPWHEGHREALTTLGNGRMAIRGAAPESVADAAHYPGTYLAGVYNRCPERVHGEEAEGEHLVNLPNWLPLDLRLPPGPWWSDGGLTLVAQHRELDLKRAVLFRRAVLEDARGRRLEVHQRRIVSMAQPGMALLETTLTARGWDGPVELRTGIDADVVNGNVPEDAALGGRHLRVVDRGVRSGIESVEVLTRQSRLRIAVAAGMTFTGPDGAPAAVSSTPVLDTGHAAGSDSGSEDWTDGASDGGSAPSRWLQHHAAVLTDGVPLTACKTVAVVSSKDRAVSSPLTAAHAVLARAPGGLGRALAAHEDAWRPLLDLFGFDLHADRQTQFILNLHVFHLLQTLSPHTAELDAGVPARGLHGEGYRGHIFWDDLFVLPLITSRLPSVTRSLLDYRWRRLDAARDRARAAGLDGAMFPWRSGSDGTEDTPPWLYNRFSGQWTPDHSHLQRHGSLAVAYNAWQYYEATADREWILGHGADLIVEVARSFAAAAEFDAGDGRFHLRGVVGPDEYHDGYPGRPGEGIDDNAYTNVLASWVLSRPAGIMDAVRGRDRRDLRRRLHVTGGELERWNRLARLLHVPFHDGVISQFAGYEQLEELDWDRYRRTYGTIERLDLLLGAEGDSTNRYRLSKQADVLMLFYLLGQEQLMRRLRRMGYAPTTGQMARTVEYYLARVSHGSTLSRVAHASVLAASYPERAWATFRDALDSDLDDTQGGTTRTGIHLGAMAGSVDVVQRSFAGLRMHADALVFTPRLPTELQRVSFRIRYRGLPLDITLGHDTLTVVAAESTADAVRVRVGRHLWVVQPGSTVRISLRTGPPPSGA